MSIEPLNVEKPAFNITLSSDGKGFTADLRTIADMIDSGVLIVDGGGFSISGQEHKGRRLVMLSAQMLFKYNEEIHLG